MAVRIYALAKELKLDSKELVDVCTKAGIHGKGSALASLTEEEVERVKQFLKGGTAKPKPTKSGPPKMERPKESKPSGKMPVLVTATPPEPQKSAEPASSPPSPEASQSSEDAASEKDADLAPSSDSTDSTPSETEPKAAEGPPAPRRPGPLAGAMHRGEPMAPGQALSHGKVPTIENNGGDVGRKKGPGQANGGGRARPAVKFAPMPKPAQPTAKSSSKEPPAQKPDMKLPSDVLGGTNKPLASHLRRHERTLDAERRDRGGKEAPPAEGAGTAGRGRGRRGKEGAETPPAGGKPILGGREQRQLLRSRGSGRGPSGGRPPHRRFNRRPKRTGLNTAAPRKERVSVELPCTVRELSEAAGVQAADILRILMGEGVMTTITAIMDPDLTEFVAAELGIDIEFKQAVSLEDKLLTEFEEYEDNPADLVERPPVITFLGHVDHGKTSLLDSIIGIDVVSGESGGITQHIRAYTMNKDGKQISFVDTPGHEAFTEMRARGANVTDIAVLVVAADDGVMPQTEEAISHARAAEVPIVVALNKTDLPGVDETKALQGLSANELLPSEWGGDVEVVKTSAITGAGVDELLDTVLTVAELREYKANPNRPAIGTCLESQQESDRGVIAKVIVQNGTLRIGDIVVCGHAHGRVKAMADTLHPQVMLTEAGPSTPVNLVGFDIAPGAGEHFYVLDDITRARSIAESRADYDRSSKLGNAGFQHVTLENLFDRLDGTEEVQTLNLILRADVRGSIEAIQKEFMKLEHPEVKVKILQATVGGVSEADVHLADASDAVIIGFNVVPDEKARLLAEETGVQIRRYSVIYKITDDLRAAMEGMLKPEEREVEQGRALVQRVFKISRVGTIAGCRVLAGLVQRNSRARVIRDNTIIGDYPLDTLRREKDDSKEVREGYECGIKLAGFNDIKEGDLLEIYKVEEISRSFDD